MLQDLTNIFRSSPDLYLVLDDSLKIVEVSEAYLLATNTTREEILGKNIFEIFPDNPDDPYATGVQNLTDSLLRVIKSGVPDTMAVQKYDIRKPSALGGGFETRYWSPHNSPVLDEHGKVKYIIHKVEDVTEYIRLKQVGLKQVQLADELRTQAGKLEIEIYKRAQQLQEANKQLRLAKESADKANNIKSAFLAAMSHEIRTPLNGIISMTELLLETQVDSEQKDALDIIKLSGEALMAIINDILDFSKLESGQVTIDIVEFNIKQLIEESLEIVTPHIKKKGLTVKKILDRNLPEFVYGDPGRIRQVLTNLLSNATKFTDKGGIILSVSVSFNDANIPLVYFEIQDTGIGFTPAVKSHLFHAFYQGDNSMTKKYGGTGLGLAISKQLVEVMGGNIDAESTLGKGSKFWFTLPLCVDENVNIKKEKVT